ncbi:MAG TPA: type II secretion system protein GspJ [Syntrophales bacterium]|nr:type II secretion system protein GspJ [Syntrophales bacterium]
MRQRRAGTERGFTLLELLITMVVLLLIVVFATGALSLGSRSVAKGEARMEYLERLRMSFSTIRAQIESQIPLRIEEEGTRRFAFRGDSKSLQFATGYSAWGSEKGPVMVSYQVEDDGKGRQVLRVSETISGTDAKRETILLEASEISFEYETFNPIDPAAAWGESWTETETLPERVRVRLADGRKSFVLSIPTRSMGVITTGPQVTASRERPRGPIR